MNAALPTCNFNFIVGLREFYRLEVIKCGLLDLHTFKICSMQRLRGNKSFQILENHKIRYDAYYLSGNPNLRRGNVNY